MFATTMAATMALDFRVRGLGLQDFMFFDPEGSTDLGFRGEGLGSDSL